MRPELISQPITGICSFGRYPICLDLDELKTDFGVLGVPFDMDVGFLSGSRMGPRRIREASTQYGRGEVGYYDYERDEQNIEDDNSEQNRATIEKTFMDLMDLANSMDQEEQRYVREGFSSDEELSLYDLLFSENLSKQDIQKIKQVAVDLLAKVKAKIAELDHWTDKQETKAAVDNLIRDTLWAELPECYDEVSISGYRQKIYEYVYTRYPDVA